VTDERRTGTIVALKYDHGVLLAVGGRTNGSCRLDGLYGHVAVGACGDAPPVAQLHRAGLRFADIRAWHRRRTDISSRTLAFAYASVLILLTSESPVRPNAQLLIAGAADLYEITADGRVIEIDRFGAIGRDGASALDGMSGMARDDLDLDAACLIAMHALRREPDLELAGVDERRRGGGFFRVPSSLVHQVGSSQSREGGLRS
jgi:20S proteasome alpha/beta subunit